MDVAGARDAAPAFDPRKEPFTARPIAADSIAISDSLTDRRAFIGKDWHKNFVSRKHVDVMFVVVSGETKICPTFYRRKCQ